MAGDGRRPFVIATPFLMVGPPAAVEPLIGALGMDEMAAH
jgi:hypothetical protein